MSLNKRLRELERHVESRGGADTTCPTCNIHGCWKRGLGAVHECQKCPEPAYMVIMPVGSHGITDYYLISEGGKQYETKEHPKEIPPCPDCGHKWETFEIDLGGERDGEELDS